MQQIKLLLETGVHGFAEMTRRKLQLDTYSPDLQAKRVLTVLHFMEIWGSQKVSCRRYEYETRNVAGPFGPGFAYGGVGK